MNIILSSTLTGLAPIKKALYENLLLFASARIEFQLFFTSEIVNFIFTFPLSFGFSSVYEVGGFTFVWAVVTTFTTVCLVLDKISATIT